MVCTLTFSMQIVKMAQFETQPMNTHKSQVIKDIVSSIRRVVRSVYQDSRNTKKRFGLTGPQAAVIQALGSLGPMSSAALSRVLYMSPANVTGIVDRLERDGWVKRVRSTTDRRIALVELTENGTGMSEQIPDPIEDRLIRGLSDMSMAEAAGIHAVVSRLVDLLDVEEEDDAPLTADPETWETGN